MTPGLQKLLEGTSTAPEFNLLIAALVSLKAQVDKLSPDELFDRAAELVEKARDDFGARIHAAALAASTAGTDVHTEHCCAWRGCKYGYDRFTDEERKEFEITEEDRCTVTSGEKVQSYFYRTDEDMGY